MLSADNERMLRRACREISDTMLINLGIGLPQLMTRFMDKDKRPMIHAENGIVGVGEAVAYEEANPYCMDAGGVYVDVVDGACYIDSAISFGLVRRGKIDVSFLGAFQVSGQGDLANWHLPGARKTGMGGALEIASCAKKLIILMKHQDRDGRDKILPSCTYPLTARRCVDQIITEKAVLSVLDTGLQLDEVAEGLSVDNIRAITSAPFSVSPRLTTF